MQYTLFLALAPVAILVLVAVIGYALRHRHVPGSTAFAWLLLFDAGWLLSNTFELLGFSESATVFFAKLNHTFIAGAALGWLAFALDYTGRRKWLSPQRFALLCAIPIITTVCAQTNEWHGLIWRSYDIVRVEPGLSMRPSAYGAWFWVQVTYAYVALLTGSFLLGSEFFRSFTLYRRQSIWLIVGALAPLIANVIYIFRLIPGLQKDYSSLSFAFAGVAFAVAMFRYRLFDLKPIARNLVIDRMSDGMLVLDDRQRIVDINPTARQTLGVPESAAVGQFMEALAEPFCSNVRRLCAAGAEAETNVAVTEAGSTRHYNLRLLPLVDSGTIEGYVVVLRDVTEHKRVEAEKFMRLEEEAIIEERRRIAREIHDGLAQDLASLHLRLNVWQTLIDADPAKLRGELERAQKILAENIRDVRRSIFALRPIVLDKLGFFLALQQLATAFSEQHDVRVDLDVQGPQDRLTGFLEPVLIRIIQEALNNVSKHARAKQVRLLVDLRAEEYVSAQIQDTGIGFDPATLNRATVRGHLGLAQMRERVENLGGTFELNSQAGQGTCLRVTLPLKQPVAVRM
ncbi:MAG: PAS domain S-box protein [Chloroflexi bacterium]|nr:PAS domain S-box protein [Chloroflexota bacterium]